MSPNTAFLRCRHAVSVPMISWFDINPEENTMLYWALVFLVVALIAGVLGFTGIAVAAAGVAKLLFVVFLVLFLISLIAHLGRGRRSI